MNDFEQCKDEVSKAFEFNCLKNCLRIIYQYYGYDLPIANVFCGKLFAIQDGELVSNYQEGCLVSNQLDKIIEYDVSKFTYQEVIQKDIEYLSHGYPIIIAVDPFFLPYSQNFGVKHAHHTVILKSINEETQIANILDWYFDENYDGEIMLQDLKLARLSENEGNGIMNFSSINAKSIICIPSLANHPVSETLYDFCKVVVSNFYLTGWKALIKTEKNYYAKLDSKETWDKYFDVTFKELMFLNTRTEVETFYYQSIIDYTDLDILKNILSLNNEISGILKILKALSTKLCFNFNHKSVDDFKKLFRNYLIIEREKYHQLMEVMSNLEILKEEKCI